MSDFFSTLLDEFPQVRAGLWVTLEATVLGSLLALLLSFVLGLMAGSKLLPVRGVSRVVVEFFRGTSLYIQLFWLYYAMPQLTGYELTPLLCGIVAFGLNYGAYGAEIVRGAIKSVPRAQYEAAVALNMTPFHRMRKVIMPQAWVQMIPSFTNLLIQLLKATPLLWLISAADLMTAVEHIRSRTGETLTAYLLLLAAYFVLAYALTLLMNLLERAAKRRLGLHTGAGSLLKSRTAESAATAGGAR
ncbi:MULTISPECIES: ectoine/hydroxyectoine ABC transporter permease subunit EhuC [unclassified Streptomyces]|uniref:Ectoine/hydroxyectoine ABC transporter permease subunit EhuC n=2 Tax=Streptomyces TaxID=1883 RepID=A0ABU2RBH5_9ACTN|nr:MULTISPECIES: ectoine/hydroxyectoine ABC transporter permease subunit EhuC [unclassified Streptomyces]AEN10200.1 ectoine/hydroxyectoine ABC transporter, permease protein EhuC [Streptomyces sp. SirexAA-E]MBK3592126.1 ectoine/hydroxyectoine ABC transporter permease subunit EhuC [Streptomyces sp. MBT51]MDT0426220.1 ectoine/hydroxyectoine ABC transporter permease subunit EhuC [Streptomyces sp. DSM 41770]MYR66947.1 ectoine/hydroxyectoine ABC transporter permease subunit EhuC [Streptomyces sp. SID